MVNSFGTKKIGGCKRKTYLIKSVWATFVDQNKKTERDLLTSTFPIKPAKTMSIPWYDLFRTPKTKKKDFRICFFIFKITVTLTIIQQLYNFNIVKIFCTFYRKLILGESSTSVSACVWDILEQFFSVSR